MTERDADAMPGSAAARPTSSQPAEASQFVSGSDGDGRKQMQREKKRNPAQSAEQPAKRLGVVFEDLSVKGAQKPKSYVKTLPWAILGSLGLDLWRFAAQLIARPSSKATSDLLHSFTGVARDGEIVLVLGRPGSGCSTFLKTIANIRAPYASVSGNVTYGGIAADEMAKRYRGEIVYLEEPDQHFAPLTVRQTLEIALLSKTARYTKEGIASAIQALLHTLGIEHTMYTLIGDGLIRGVSGGERRRVSIAESFATKSTVLCLDSSTRGLDANTALEHIEALRIMTDRTRRTTFITLYQVSEDIYNLMDKVIVIDKGRMIFQGAAADAKQYFTDLGFHCPERQTTADFLSAVTDPKGRQFKPVMDGIAPKEPEELEMSFRNSAAYKKVLDDVRSYKAELHESNYQDAQTFQKVVKSSKSKAVPSSSHFTVTFAQQVFACCKREVWLVWGDKTSLYTRYFIMITNALMVGSLFYGQSLSTDGAFSRGGALLFSIVFLGWMQLSELIKAVDGRATIARHKQYAFYRPSAVFLARILMDVPLIFVQVFVYTVIMYLMAALDMKVEKYFIYMLFVYVNTFASTALYRLFAALSPSLDYAIRYSVISFNLLTIYTGYVIPRGQLLSQYPWVGWIYWVNPISYAFEAVMANEFSDRTMTCSPSQVVPAIPGANPQNQGCALKGSQPYSTSNPNPLVVTGADYLESAFSTSRAVLWRNLGILFGFALVYITLTLMATELFSFTKDGSESLQFKRIKNSKKDIGLESVSHPERGLLVDVEESAGISQSSHIFTWRNVTYTVPHLRRPLQLLNEVSGYAKPGVSVALLGASGAGKTTLLNALSQHHQGGTVGGEILLDGRALGPEFQRGTGLCEQIDLHDGSATVQEAIEFSAKLRQGREEPLPEKLAYVKKIIELLELEDVRHAIISSLSLEQLKRVTIAVELVAKPETLLFLDEPTSGLDALQAASIVRFLKKLATAGQAIVCTLHQPSAQLIAEFDMILAMNPGGNTFYFGPYGEDGSGIVRYFGDRGVLCPAGKNVAELILETAARESTRSDGSTIDWNAEWKASKENQALLAEIDHICEQRRSEGRISLKIKHEFASTFYSQTLELTKRISRQYWRDSSYLYGKIFTSLVVNLFIGITYFQLGFSITDMQNRMFASFLIINILPPTVVNGVLPKFYNNRALWEQRELPSRIYGWPAFCTASILAEIPWALFCAVISWPLWYFPSGMPTDSATMGYVFLMNLLFFLYMSSWGQWVCAFAPSHTVVSNVLPFFLVVFAVVNGVMRPYDSLPSFWSSFVYKANPSAYWIGGIAAATMKDISVRCLASELVQFVPPVGQTCAEYAGAWVSSTVGYLDDPHNMEMCGYCPYSRGVDYLATLNIKPGDKWPDLGVFAAFCCSNWALVYFFIYTVRIRKWSFGLATVVGWINGVVGSRH